MRNLDLDDEVKLKRAQFCLALAFVAASLAYLLVTSIPRPHGGHDSLVLEAVSDRGVISALLSVAIVASIGLVFTALVLSNWRVVEWAVFLGVSVVLVWRWLSWSQFI